MAIPIESAILDVPSPAMGRICQGFPCLSSLPMSERLPKWNHNSNGHTTCALQALPRHRGAHEPWGAGEELPQRWMGWLFSSWHHSSDFSGNWMDSQVPDFEQIWSSSKGLTWMWKLPIKSLKPCSYHICRKRERESSSLYRHWCSKRQSNNSNASKGAVFPTHVPISSIKSSELRTSAGDLQCHVALGHRSGSRCPGCSKMAGVRGQNPPQII